MQSTGRGTATDGRRPKGRRASATLRTALLLLLSERDGHGYELADRLRELGLACDMGAMYRTLRSMDDAGEVRSSWDHRTARGPGRRVYVATEQGLGRLRAALAGMEQHRAVIGRVLDRARTVPAAAMSHG